MNGLWLPVCLLGGPVEDLPVFGTYGRKVYLFLRLDGFTNSMFAQTTFVPTNYFAVGTPRWGGGAHVHAYSYMHFMCHFCHGCPSQGGLPVCPCASMLLI